LNWPRTDSRCCIRFAVILPALLSMYRYRTASAAFWMSSHRLRRSCGTDVTAETGVDAATGAGRAWASSEGPVPVWARAVDDIRKIATSEVTMPNRNESTDLESPCPASTERSRTSRASNQADRRREASVASGDCATLCDLMN